MTLTLNVTPCIPEINSICLVRSNLKMRICSNGIDILGNNSSIIQISYLLIYDLIGEKLGEHRKLCLILHPTESNHLETFPTHTPKYLSAIFLYRLLWATPNLHLVLWLPNFRKSSFHSYTKAHKLQLSWCPLAQTKPQGLYGVVIIFQPFTCGLV